MKRLRINKQVKLSEPINAMLDEISQARKLAGALNSTKQGIVAELITNLHKKETKRQGV
jgi:hypothetical protein